MNIRLWYNECMGMWRWTLIDKDLNQESGQQPQLHDVMIDIENTVNYLLRNKE